MASKLRQQILELDDTPIEKGVVVPEWGSIKIDLYGMSGKERSDTLMAARGRGGVVDLNKLYPDLIISCARDPETGERIFEPEDRDVLNRKSASALERVATICARLSGLDPDSFRSGEDAA